MKQQKLIAGGSSPLNSYPAEVKLPRRTLHLLLNATVASATLLFSACAELQLGPPPDNRVVSTQPATAAILPAESQYAPTTAPATTSAADPSLELAPTTEPATAPTTSTQPATQDMGTGPLKLSVHDALLIALEHNTSLRVQRYNPLISRTGEESAKSVFDPTLSAQVTTGRTASPSGSQVGSPDTSYNNNTNGGVALQQYFPTGTTVGVTADTGYSSSEDYSDTNTRLGMTVNQALLRGAGLKVNLASLRQSEISTKISQYELRSVAESLVSQVEQTYWNYALSERQIIIYQSSLDIAQQQLDQTNEFIRVGTIAENERAAAEAEVALRRENLINSRATTEALRLKLLQLLNPGKADFWDRQIVVQQQPFIPQGAIEDVKSYVAVSLRMRPDLNQARLQIQRGDLEIIKTKNGLLPKLDLFVHLGQTGYAKALGESITNLDGPYYDALIGVKVDYPIGNAAARASYRQSVLSKEQTQESLDNLTQLAQVDVRTAFINVNRLREQIVATAATQSAQESKLNAEVEKFRVGKSTSILVAQAQRDLVQAQINHVQAVAGFLNALVSLYQAEGSLLERRGIQAPGAAPVTAAATPLPGSEVINLDPPHYPRHN